MKIRHGFGQLRPISALATVFGVVAALIVVVAPSPANADNAGAAGAALPSTVTADGLPTWQVNGVVWSQVVVGNTVYATGSFTKARPPGVAAGGAGEVTANNIFAYDITTGNRVASFNHSLNGQGMKIAATPDGSRVFVGGDFTTVDGAAHSHLAAFNTADNSLVAGFTASVSSRVSAIAATNSTVYIGGQFFNVNGSSRTRLAAVTASTGASISTWRPTADDGQVDSMVLAPGNAKVIVGGRFTTLNGTDAIGMGAVDASTGGSLTWLANQTIRNGGTNSKCSILSLSTDGVNIYGSGFAFGCGNFEGSFAANASDGSIILANDCHGDTYDTYPNGGVIYTVSHVHDCRWMGPGGFPQTDSNWQINMRHAMAFTAAPTGVSVGPDNYGWNFNGVPSSSILQWFPTLAIGSFTGQSQAAWAITGDNRYVVVGGEFPSVNGVAQQGLTRFAVRSIAPNKRGPAKVTRSADPNAVPVNVSAVSLVSGTVRVGWQSATDQDDRTLTYNVYRSGKAAPVYTTTADSTYWDYPMQTYQDTGLTPGSTYTYTLKASDAWGNTTNIGSATVTVSNAPLSAYQQDVINDGPAAYWRLGESSGSAVYDYVGANDALAQAGVGRGATGAVAGDPDGASTFNGSSTGQAISPAMPTTPDFAIEAWVKTTTTNGGKIVGYGNSSSGQSSAYDRHVYMDNAGHILFGVYPGGVQLIASPKTYNDGQYHQIVAQLSSTKGMTLSIDGKKVAQNTTVTSAQDYPGYWHIGGDNLGGWPSQPSSSYLNGTIDDVAIYSHNLTQTQIQTHYTDSGRTVGTVPVPTDTYGKAVVAAQPDIYWRLGEASGTTANDSSGNGNDGIYFGVVGRGIPSAVTGTSDTAASFNANGTGAGVGSVDQWSNPNGFTEELWFKTSTTHGGKLIGFGNQQSGLSSAYDRHVYMENDGRLTFGVWTGAANTATSPLSYNDNKWHYMVASQGVDGMKLYVDGNLVATNPQTGSQDYTGYWRVGGDNAWAGDSPWFNGQIDEVAIYSTVLSQNTILSHYGAGGGAVPNVPPTASIAADTSTGKIVKFDGTGSTDSDGTITNFLWNFGDGTTSTSATPTHTYAAPGTYTVTLKVTDNSGGTNTASKSVPVTDAAPTAAFTHTESFLKTTVDGTTSTDSDGTVASYDWDWGDGTAHGSGSTASHTYGADGTYAVTLTVTDEDGVSDVVVHNVTVVGNKAPNASITSSQDELTINVDGNGSTDADGNVVGYDWNWGDGTTHGNTAAATHTYAAAGTYTVTLTVTDDQGATDVATKSFTVALNKSPIPVFTTTVNALTVNADSAGSSDPDGTIASYDWSWGDGTANSSGASPSHTYGTPGTYTVTLTVKDNKGAQASVQHDVVVAAPTVLASDGFNRTVAKGWGTADIGGAWSLKGSSSNFAVANGASTITIASAGGGPSAFLSDVSSTDTDSTVTFSADTTPTGTGTYVYLIGREVPAGGGYRAAILLKPNGSVSATINRRTAAGGQTSMGTATVPGLTVAAGQKVNAEFVVSGSGTTALKLKVWAAGTTKPTAWLLDTTDNAPDFQGAGSVGLMGYLASSSTSIPTTISFSSFKVVPNN